MLNFIAPIIHEYAIAIPEDPIALIGWLIWFVLLVLIIIRIRDRDLSLDRQMLVGMAVLSISILIFTPFFGLAIPIDSFTQVDARPVQHWMFFAAVPWLLAGGLLGVLPSVFLSGMSGLLLAYLDTHNIFTPLVFMTLAVSFSWAVRQRFRTKPHRLLRIPFFAAFFSLVVILPFTFFAIILRTPGVFPFRLATAFELTPSAILPISGMLLIGSVICVVTQAIFHKKWGSSQPLKPSPGEVSIRYRWFATALTVLLVLMIVVLTSLWYVNENNARRTMINRLMETSTGAEQVLPIFMTSGRNLISEIAGYENLAAGSPDTLNTLLNETNPTMFLFEELFLMNPDGEVIVRFPQSASVPKVESISLDSAINQVLTKGLVEIVSPTSDSEEQSVDVNFFAGVKNKSGNTVWILWGKTGLMSNPVSKLFSKEFAELERQGGIIQIIDEEGYCLYHTDPSRIMTVFLDTIFDTPTYIEGVSTDGQAIMQYFQPINELGWAVVTSLPVQAQHVMAWESIYPLGLFGFGTILVVLLIGSLAFSSVAKQINNIKDGIVAVSNGKYDIKISQKRNSGEIGQLAKAYNQMVGSLVYRIQKQSDLLSVSERLSNEDNLNAIMEIIMKAALAHGVSSVRIILAPSSENIESDNSRQRSGMGKLNEAFAGLDDQILDRVRSEGFLLMRDFKGHNILQWKEGIPTPASIIAAPLQWQTYYLGVLWVTYQNLRFPDNEEVAFFKGLAQKTAMSVSNISTMVNAVAIRQQLETLLNSLPDAVFITDRVGNLVYKNKTSKILSELDEPLVRGAFLSSLMKGAEISAVLDDMGHVPVPKVIRFDNGKIFKVIEYTLEDEGQMIGKAILFSDITNQEIQETLRTEFVTTVSHELRSPLTLIHGYAKILQLTGNLNEQQDDYINNIVDVIEEMKDLVKKLLDIGHLEGGDSLEITQFFATDLMNKVVDSVDAQAKQKNIQVTFLRTESPLSIDADRTFMNLALKNLLENAIKFTKMGGEVSLSVRRNDDDVVFSVKDNGIGIAPLDQRHLFEKFHRGRAQVGSEQKGRGLGLTIVKSIAERHGGKVWLESQLGRGSTFYLQIPQHPKM
ncbi:MAG: ATP-binding protein [Chloroflexota bacterium]|nr:ATP-binding protein [Chloroflexota bacterium]